MADWHVHVLQRTRQRACTGTRSKRSLFRSVQVCPRHRSLSPIATLSQLPRRCDAWVPCLQGYRRLHRPTVLQALVDGLREHGWEEGRNVVLEVRYAGPDPARLVERAVDLVELKVDAIVIGNAQALDAARRNTTTIPIVMAGTGVRVGQGFIQSLARPGGKTHRGREPSGDRIRTSRLRRVLGSSWCRSPYPIQPTSMKRSPLSCERVQALHVHTLLPCRPPRSTRPLMEEWRPKIETWQAHQVQVGPWVTHICCRRRTKVGLRRNNCGSTYMAHDQVGCARLSISLRACCRSGSSRPSVNQL